MMMVRRGPRKTVLWPKVVMFRRVGMPGETNRLAAAKQCQELSPVAGVRRRIVRIEIVSQGNVHDRDNQGCVGFLSQQIGGKGELPFAEKASVFARAARLGRIGAK